MSRVVEQVLKVDRDGGAYCVRDGQSLLFMKRRLLHRVGYRVYATFGRSDLANQVRMTKVAQKAGLSVAPVVAHVRRRRCGVVVEESLFCPWYADRQPLSTWARRAAESHDESALARARQMLADWLGAVRRAGLADRDLGAHNLLIDKHADQLIWVDLEHAYRAPAHRAQATRDTLGAAIANWFVAVHSDQAEITALFDASRRAMPEPTSGWAALLDDLNRVIVRRTTKAKRYGNTDRIPDPLTLSLLGANSPTAS